MRIKTLGQIRGFVRTRQAGKRCAGSLRVDAPAITDRHALRQLDANHSRQRLHEQHPYARQQEAPWHRCDRAPHIGRIARLSIQEEAITTRARYMQPQRKNHETELQRGR